MPEYQHIIETLYKKLQQHLHSNPTGAKVAGRLIYFDKENNSFILGARAVHPDRILELATKFWDSLPDQIKTELKANNIGFAGRQI